MGMLGDMKGINATDFSQNANNDCEMV